MKMEDAKTKTASANEEADAPTDEEAEFTLALKSDKDLEVQNAPTEGDGGVNVESEGLDAAESYVSKKAKYTTTEDVFASDDDSVDYALKFDERYLDDEGTIAFCCQNCQ